MFEDLKILFNQLKEGTNCDCLRGSQVDTENLFVRRMGKNKTPKPRDFQAFWGKRTPKNPLDCEEVCGLKGVSIDLGTVKK